MYAAVIFSALLAVVSAGQALASPNATIVTGISTASENALWLSAATYCSPDTYLTREFVGPTKGFVATKEIYDKKSDTTGYIGYLPSDKHIYVLFRGSSSIQNWISDLDAIKTDYTTFPECKCKVHKGFFDAEQQVASFVVDEVRRLKGELSGYSVTVAGHSLGAALSHLMAMDIKKAGIDCDVINFGMPRVGTPEYSAFAASKVPSTTRYTHHQDQVPHLPFEDVMSFQHVCTEHYEDADGNVKKCDSSCEDPSCADQFPFAQTNWDDHHVYLGLPLECGQVS
jgi:hypothetical protein